MKSKQELVNITLRLHSLLTASVHAHLCARMKRKQMRGATPTIIKSHEFTDPQSTRVTDRRTDRITTPKTVVTYARAAKIKNGELDQYGKV